MKGMNLSRFSFLPGPIDCSDAPLQANWRQTLNTSVDWSRLLLENWWVMLSAEVSLVVFACISESLELPLVHLVSNPTELDVDCPGPLLLHCIVDHSIHSVVVRLNWCD